MTQTQKMLLVVICMVLCSFAVEKVFGAEHYTNITQTFSATTCAVDHFTIHPVIGGLTPVDVYGHAQLIDGGLDSMNWTAESFMLSSNDAKKVEDVRTMLVDYWARRKGFLQ